MNRRALTFAALSATALSLTFVACGQSNDEETEAIDETPIVGLYEIPISRSNQATAPTSAAHLDISPTLMRLDGVEVLTMERGRPADAEVSDHIITKLRQRLTSGAPRERVALRMDANTPYLTFVEVLNTLKSANQHRVLLAVRTPGESPREAWMALPRYQVLAEDAEVTWNIPAVPWSAFTEHWEEVYNLCREGQYIDCDGPYARTAEGGELAMELWTRGQGMKVTWTQINGPEQPAGGGGGGGVALIEGVQHAPAAANPDEGLSPPATTGAFTVRHQESTSETSALSSFSQLVCGNRACQATVVTDATTPMMRPVSMIGAVFANGFTEPELVFRIPETH
ncbi:MAG: ExbD/TolR family protein [Sandaracinaceae bacterium]